MSKIYKIEYEDPCGPGNAFENEKSSIIVYFLLDISGVRE